MPGTNVATGVCNMVRTFVNFGIKYCMCILCFSYEWVKWSDRKKDNCGMVHCGESAPVLMLGSDGSKYCGDMNTTSETLLISHDGKTEVGAD